MHGHIYIWKTKLSSEEAEPTYGPAAQALESPGGYRKSAFINISYLSLFAVTVLPPYKSPALYLSLIIRVTLSNRIKFILEYIWPPTFSSIFFHRLFTANIWKLWAKAKILIGCYGQRYEVQIQGGWVWIMMLHLPEWPWENDLSLPGLFSIRVFTFWSISWDYCED